MAIRSAGVPCRKGLIRSNSSQALGSASSAKAMIVQTAAWVYWPPFSRTPGT